MPSPAVAPLPPGKTKKIEAVKQGGINDKGGWDLTALASGDDNLVTTSDVQQLQQANEGKKIKVGKGRNSSLSLLTLSLTHACTR